MLAGFTLGNYLLLVEYTGRMLRDGKATITAEVSDILDRIGSSADVWQAACSACVAAGCLAASLPAAAKCSMPPHSDWVSVV